MTCTLQTVTVTVQFQFFRRRNSNSTTTYVLPTKTNTLQMRTYIIAEYIVRILELNPLTCSGVFYNKGREGGRGVGGEQSVENEISPVHPPRCDHIAKCFPPRIRHRLRYLALSQIRDSGENSAKVDHTKGQSDGVLLYP